MDEEVNRDINAALRPKTDLPRLLVLRQLFGFWIVGLCNNIGYEIALTAAYDLLKNQENAEETAKKEFLRNCHIVGTGTVLLADTLPAIIVKSCAPFLPLCIHVRISIVIILNTIGFMLLGFGLTGDPGTDWLLFVGIPCLSAACGLGESSYLAYTTFFPTRNVISTWSSGTGASVFMGSLLYSAIKEADSVGKTSALVMLIWPFSMALAFWLLIPHPKIDKFRTRFSTLEASTGEEMTESMPAVEDPHTILGKLKILRRMVCKYNIPYALEFFIAFFINQTLFEVLYYGEMNISRESQYRWFETTYNLGVFIARSSMNILQFSNLWCLTFLQGINMIVLFSEAIVGFFYFSIFCHFYIFWEGLISGAMYVHTYRRIRNEMPPLQRQFAMSINSFGDDLGIILAGLISIPAHTYICKTPSPYESAPPHNDMFGILLAGNQNEIK